MAELRDLYASLGYLEVRSYIQSGNVVFRHSETDLRSLAGKIGKAIADTFGYAVDVLIRTPEELDRIIIGNPFIGSPDTRLDKLSVTFLADVPDQSVVDQIHTKNDGEDSFIVTGAEVYIHAPGGYGKTKFSNTYIEKLLGVSATTRNWRTVNKLLELSRLQEE